MAKNGSKTSRTVERNCIEIEKAGDWPRRSIYPITHVTPFIPEHDFAQDDLYLKLSANLTVREIEWCKARTMGFTAINAIRQIQPTLPQAGMSGTSTNFQGREDLLDLIKLFTSLWNKYHNPLSFDPAEAVTILITEVRNATGIDRFKMMKEIIPILGIENEIKDVAHSILHLGTGPAPEEESVEDFLARLQKNGKVRRTPPGEEDGDAVDSEDSDAAF